MASGGASFAAGLAAGASPPAPMRAMGAPILAGTPCSTMILSPPSSSDSRSNVALSDSTSAITSPFLTTSPLFFFHSTTVPSSIVSESLGMFTSAIEPFPTDHLARQPLDVLDHGDRCLLEREAVRHGHLRAAQPANRRVQVVEAALLHPGCNLSRNAISRPALLDHHAAVCAPNRLDDRRPVDRPDRAEVDDLHVDVLFFQLLRPLVGEHSHPRHADDREVGTLAAHCGSADRRRVVAVRNHAAHVVQAHRLQEHHLCV